jgi:hypothetical protein
MRRESVIFSEKPVSMIRDHAPPPNGSDRHAPFSGTEKPGNVRGARPKIGRFMGREAKKSFEEEGHG